ncbi:hypothetical protein GF377_11180, partial [candidate division GN15 bacterium]|nr:hypothetical protein [candidate division GN15 bacterium]
MRRLLCPLVLSCLLVAGSVLGAEIPTTDLPTAVPLPVSAEPTDQDLDFATIPTPHLSVAEDLARMSPVERANASLTFSVPKDADKTAATLADQATQAWAKGNYDAALDLVEELAATDAADLI